MDNQPDTQPVAKRATWRMGVRERTRLQWAVVAVICVLMIIGLRPWFVGVLQTRDFSLCQVNVRKMAVGLRQYMTDWDDTMPPAATWVDCVASGMAPTSGTGFKWQRYFKCPHDQSSAPSSYAYNSLFTGVRTTVKSSDPAVQDRVKQLLHPERAPAIVERYNSPLATNAALPDWSAVRAYMTLPHEVPVPTGSLVLGDGSAARVTREELDVHAGRRF